MQCANKLCGIEDITVSGEDIDFLSYLLRRQEVTNAFAVAAVLGLIVLVFFTILAIIRLIVKEKPDVTIAQICVKAMKSVLTFLFIPAIMIIGVWVSNAFMQALYKATLAGSGSMGNFLFTAFSDGAWVDPAYSEQFINGSLSFETAEITTYVNLEDFDYFASWITGAVILWNVAWSLLVFVDRAISIVILYIASPFPVAASVLDDGSHFKLWREQILTKFFVGFGTIIAINVYCLIVLLVMNSDLQFFSSNFLNNMCKILFIIGGSLTMKKAMALVGNLVTSGGGSNELRDNAFAGNALGGALLGGLKAVSGVALKPVTWGASRVGNAVNRGVEDKIGNKIFGSHYGGGKDGTTGDRNLAGDDNERGNGNGNHNEAQVEGNNNLGELIRNSGDRQGNNNDNNNNNNDNLNRDRGNAVLNAMQNQDNLGGNNFNDEEDMR